jgi:SEC-C motif-containing protein
MKHCPCHSSQSYADCCQPFHQGMRPQTALQLMRSRYAAYALQLADYIMETTHPENPGYNQNRADWAKQIVQWTRQTRFEGLEILEHTEGTKEAFVHFKAILNQAGTDGSFTEKSRFLKVADRWLYHSGVFE